MIDHTVFVAARDEYTEYLCEIINPVIIQAFSDIYVLAEKDLKKFQLYLQEIKHWNPSIIKEHTDAITKHCPCLNELISAIIVCHSQILARARIGSSENKKLTIKIPSPELFVHHCYINCAKNVYYDPDIFRNTSMDDFEKEAELSARFCPCIKATIKDLVPYQHILTTYIGQHDGEADVDMGQNDIPEDPDVEDEPPPAVPEAPVGPVGPEAPVGPVGPVGPAAPAAQEPQTEEDVKNDEEFFDDESKWIDSGNRHMPQRPQQSSQSFSSGPAGNFTEMNSPTPNSSNQPH